MLALDARAARATWTVLLILLGVWCLYEIRKTVLIFVMALLLSSLMGPIAEPVDRFHSQRIPRSLSIGVLYLLLLTLLGAGLYTVGARAVEEASALADTIPKYTQNPQLLNEIPLPAWLEEHRHRLAEFVRVQFQEHAEELMTAVTSAGKGLLSALTNIVYVILIPILSFFFLKDSDWLRALITEQFSSGPNRAFIEDVWSDVHVLLVEFMRAMVLLCSATFAIFAIALGIMGVPYALLLSVVAGVFEFVPVAGPLSAAVAILAVAGFAGYAHLGWIVVFLVVYRLLLDYLLQPYLMGQGVELPPLAIIFGVLAGEQIGGVLGMFLSIPALATLRILYVQHHKDRTPASVAQDETTPAVAV
ncbi:MAG: AI-2E family transporter [Acidobacteria bacterium]|nr:AI-2E family transporter [Acidobacteriota bacterium]